MRTRLLITAAAVLTLAAPVLAEPPKPAVVIQAQPVSRLLAESREVVRQVGGPAEGGRLVKQFDEGLREVLGEQGFEGLDIDRPLAGYVVLRETIEDTGLVLVVPVAGEKEFVAFLKRVEVKATPAGDKKGLYTLEFPDPDLFPKPSQMRITDDGWAYLGLNGESVADAKNLVPIRELLAPADQSMVSARLFPGRVPEKLVTHWLNELDTAAKGLKGMLGGALEPEDAKTLDALVEHGPKFVRRYAEAGLKEAAEVGLRLNWDPKTGDAAIELTVMPKPGTGLARDIAAQTPTTNRFAGLLSKDVAAGGVMRFPVVKELQEITIAQMEGTQKQFKEIGLPEAFQPLVEEYVKGAIRTTKKGVFDYGLAVTGPNKDGKFTVIGGLSFDDTSGLDAALRKAAKSPEFGKFLELDAAKLEGATVHKVKLDDVFPGEVADVLAPAFGADAEHLPGASPRTPRSSPMARTRWRRSRSQSPPSPPRRRCSTSC
jgi:hypothetical protein